MSEVAGLAGTAAWSERPPHCLHLPGGCELDMRARPLVMGILNVTPDSFSDGGQFLSASDAVVQGRRMCAEGADLIDVGGESTRPGSEPVSVEEEKRRVIPVIRELAARISIPISIDTQKAEVAAAGLDAGARIINDVSALRTDPEMAPLAAERRVPVVLMHMQGTPKTMQQHPTYEEVVGDVCEWLRQRVRFAVQSGIGRDRLVVDPGFGFGKTLQHNLELLRRLHELHALGLPVLVGTSRKSMLGRILDVAEGARLYGTLATVACAALSGVHIVRVHDVAPAVQVVKVCEAIRRGAEYRNG